MAKDSVNVANISANLSSVPVLNGTNFKDRKENIEIVLRCMDMDLAIRMEKPTTPTAISSSKERDRFEKWDRSNRMSLMIIKRAIPEVFKGAVSEDITNAKEYLAEIEKRIAKSDRAETSTILKSLISMKYKGKANIREYIMEMSNLALKLKALKLDLHEDLLVHLILISLRVQFNHFKVSFNCQKETWSLNELISHCVQEEERLNQEKTESAHLASTSKDKGKKRKNVNVAGPSEKKQHKGGDLCFFCNKPEHMKKECAKYRAWREKKGTFLNLVCSEVNLASVPRNTWWLDSGATTNISISMQGCLRYRSQVMLKEVSMWAMENR
ncbi:uncharacterized protein [Primulina huaijiensis]|uniref:uncharacterized protein n=1 Tax=Primulina huaijiensis TaxID=1492673 RepID=UPI003CC70A85